MKEVIKIGIIIADKTEFDSLKSVKSSEKFISEGNLYGYKTINYKLQKGSKTIIILAILSGVGLTCASAATAFLISEHIDICINAGLSGGISGVSQGDFFIGTSYVEHDFDLTPLGYKIGQRVDMDSVFFAHENLIDLFKQTFKNVKSGNIVSGNSFVASQEKKNFLKETFNAQTCDMESAAIAYVCSNNDVPFISLRRVSDTADDNAHSDYTQYAVEQKINSLMEAVTASILNIFDVDDFWE